MDIQETIMGLREEIQKSLFRLSTVHRFKEQQATKHGFVFLNASFMYLA